MFDHDGHSVPVTASIGVACPQALEPSEEVLKRADAHLYCAKAKGRNCVVASHL
ncbi:MAG: diguanylate cyclase [Halomonas sp.]|nr:diguanylate cyclase [Halomonas sp.]MBR2514189.1 diguanylate cyclase [Halomonas sp.]